jgi:hypothetical protein
MTIKSFEKNLTDTMRIHNREKEQEEEKNERILL